MPIFRDAREEFPTDKTPVEVAEEAGFHPDEIAFMLALDKPQRPDIREGGRRRSASTDSSKPT
ncbi:hypothetical protein [Jiella sp. M17.18]|uniref:hypothetical protein n=1 Tax=Jiella sp. M17.18 TaxID=3234247 RepID=UPI0034DF0FB2